MSGKKYCVELDEKVACELETIARDTAKVSPEVLISFLIVRALAPWHKISMSGGAISSKEDMDD